MKIPLIGGLFDVGEQYCNNVNSFRGGEKCKRRNKLATEIKILSQICWLKHASCQALRSIFRKFSAYLPEVETAAPCIWTQGCKIMESREEDLSVVIERVTSFADASKSALTEIWPKTS